MRGGDAGGLRVYFDCIVDSPTSDEAFGQIYGDLSAILQGADAHRLPDGARSPHRRVGLVQELVGTGAVLRAGGNASRDADPQPPRPLQLLELSQQSLAHLHAFDGADIGGEDTNRVLLEPEGFVDDADAVPQRRANDREHRLLPPGNVAGADTGTGGIEDCETERMSIPP